MPAASVVTHGAETGMGPDAEERRDTAETQALDLIGNLLITHHSQYKS
ncbi:hypothetical protein CCP3SC1_1740004 [Gammaproteobacteria bacterium]